MTGGHRRAPKTTDPRHVLQERAGRAVRAWIGHPAVREAVESDWWRSGLRAALDPLESAVGLLDQRGVSWLLFRSLGQKFWPRDDAPWADDYAPPPWADHPAVPEVAHHLLVVITCLAIKLKEGGVVLDPQGVSERLVLAQLVAGDWRWGDLDTMIANLNLGAVGAVGSDGRSTTFDLHAGDREKRALNSLAGQLLEPIRQPYPHRAGQYDETLQLILAEHPNVTADAIVKALSEGDEWASTLRPFFDYQDPANFRRTLQRTMKRLRSR